MSLSFILDYFIIKAFICIIFTIGLFSIAYFISLYFQHKDSKKINETLGKTKRNQKSFFIKQILKILVVIILEYIVAILITRFFETDFSSTAPFVGLFILLGLLLFKFAPSESGEATPDAGGWVVETVVPSPHDYFSSTGMTAIIGTITFTLFEFLQFLI